MKQVVIIAISLLILSVLSLIVLALNLKKNLTFDFRLSKVDLSSVISQSKINIGLLITTINNSESSLTLNKVNVDIFYKGNKVATAKKNQFVLTKGVNSNVIETVILLNKESGDLVSLLIGGEKNIPLKVKFSGTLYFIPVSFSKEIVYSLQMIK